VARQNFVPRAKALGYLRFLAREGAMKIRRFWLLSLCCRESLLISSISLFSSLENNMRRDAFKNN